MRWMAACNCQDSTRWSALAPSSPATSTTLGKGSRLLPLSPRGRGGGGEGTRRLRKSSTSELTIHNSELSAAAVGQEINHVDLGHDPHDRVIFDHHRRLVAAKDRRELFQR